jgi:hypothetical protein
MLWKEVSDMARYIDADMDVSEYVTVWDCNCSEFGKQTVMAVDDLKYLPTADVAPKADYEAVIAGQETLQKYLVKIKAEVAREIFAEIEEEIVAALESNYRALKEWDDGRCNDYILEMVNRIKGKIDALRGIEGFVEELKKK